MRMLSSQQRWRSYGASDESLDTMGIRIKNDTTSRMSNFSKANANNRILDLMERCYLKAAAAAAVLVVAGERRRISWVAAELLPQPLLLERGLFVQISQQHYVRRTKPNTYN
jgi:hypothetical protein